MTKGKMIKALKEVGIRTGDKNGSTVKLEHLKTYEITKLYANAFQSVVTCEGMCPDCLCK